MRPKKTYKCKVCGKKYKGYRQSGTCSLDCSMKNMFRNYHQLVKKQGPFYKKWKKHWLLGIKQALKKYK